MESPELRAARVAQIELLDWLHANGATVPAGANLQLVCVLAQKAVEYCRAKVAA